MVTENLEAALRLLHQYNDLDDPFPWVDAMCMYLDRSRTNYLRNLSFKPQVGDGLEYWPDPFRP